MTEAERAKMFQTVPDRALLELEDLYDNAPVGCHSLDAEGVFVRVNNTELDWLGYSRDEIVGKLTFLDVVTKEGAKLFERHFPVFKERGFVRDLEYEMRRKDGTTFPALLRASAIYDEQGRFAASRGTVTDISEFKRMQQFLSESEERYRSLVEAMAEGVILVDKDGTIRASNGSAERIFGLTMGQIMGRTPLDRRWRVVRGDGTELPGEERPAMVTLRTGRPCHNFVMGIYTPGGELRWTSASSQPLLRPGEDKPYAVVVSFADITEHKLLEEELERQARTDPLTGLTNRRFFMTLAEREVSRALRFDHPLSLLMLDIDHFKAVNDRHGHQAGDMLLRAVANALSESLRDVDVLGRLGGEEFAVVLPEADEAHARHAAERLREAVADVNVPVQGGVIRVTISVGVAQLARRNHDLEVLIRQADKALYESKLRGRNRITVAQ